MKVVMIIMTQTTFVECRSIGYAGNECIIDFNVGSGLEFIAKILLSYSNHRG